MNEQDTLYEVRSLLSIATYETNNKHVKEAYRLINALIDMRFEMAMKKKTLEDFFGKENIHTLREDLERERGE